MNPGNDSAKKVTNFMNDNPEFWGVLGAAGGLAGTGYGVYSLCSPVKSFVDDCCDWVNGDLHNAGFNILDASYTYNSNDTTKFNINFKGTSFSNLKTGVSFEKVLYATNNEKENTKKLHSCIIKNDTNPLCKFLIFSRQMIMHRLIHLYFLADL